MVECDKSRMLRMSKVNKQSTGMGGKAYLMKEVIETLILAPGAWLRKKRPLDVAQGMRGGGEEYGLLY